MHTGTYEVSTGVPDAAAERAGHFIPNVGSNGEAVSFRQYDKKKGDFRHQVQTNPHREGKISRRHHQNTVRQSDLQSPEQGQDGSQAPRTYFL